MGSPTSHPPLTLALLVAIARDAAMAPRFVADARPLDPDSVPRAPVVGPVYGVTSGVGALKDVTASPDPEHGLRLWRSHAAGVGPELDDAAARATMLVRLHQLARPGSGVGPDLRGALADALAGGGVPRLPAYGAIGTGDLTALATLGLTLTGEVPWRTPPTSYRPVPVARGEALPFLSSNAATVAVAGLGIDDLSRLLRVGEEVAALSHLALRGATQALDPRVFAAKDDPASARAAGRLRDLLAPGDAAAGPGPARIQDPFALRALPQAHGPLLDALDAPPARSRPRSTPAPRTRSGSTARPCTTASSSPSGWPQSSTRSVRRPTRSPRCRPPAPAP